MNANAGRISRAGGIAALMCAALLLAGCPWDSSSSNDSSNSSTPPSLSELADVTVAAGASGSLTFTIAGDGALTVTASSSNQTLLPDAGISGQAACTAAGSCTLTLQPAANESGSATVTVTVSDSEAQSASGSFVFTVNPPPQTSTIIGAAGGETTSANGELKLSFPAGALSEDTEITISELSGNDIPEDLRDPTVLRVYRLEPDGTQFAVPITAEATIAGGFPDGVPLVALIGDSSGTLELLSPVNVVQDANGLVASAPLTHFSDLAVAQDFGLRLLFSVTPTAVEVNERFTLSLEITKSKSDGGGEGLVPLENDDPSVIQLDASGFDPVSFTLDNEEIVTRTLGGTCLKEGVGAVFVFGLLSTLRNFFEFYRDAPTFRARFELHVSVACTPAPPPPAPPPGIVTTGLKTLPATINPLTGLEAIMMLGGLVFGPLASDGGPMALFAGTPGFVIIDLASEEVIEDFTGGPPGTLFGAVGLSRDPPGPDSAAALITFGDGANSPANQIHPFAPGAPDFGPPGSYDDSGLVFDVNPVGGDSVSNGAVISAGSVRIVRYQSASDSYELTNELLGTGIAGVDLSAAVVVEGGPALILTSSNNFGFLTFNDRSGGLNGGNTTFVGETDSGPRKLRCSPPVCAVTNFDDSTVTIVLWDGSNGATVIGNTPVGVGPVGLDLVVLANGNRGIVTTGFNDNTYTELEVGLDGTVLSTTTLPVPEGCVAPGHGAYFTDPESLKIVVSCFISANYFVANSVFSGNQ